MLQQEHCDKLINALFPFAQKMLARAGTFYPFGALINASGQVEAIGGYNGDEHPQPSEIINLLTAGFRRTWPSCRKCGRRRTWKSEKIT